MRISSLWQRIGSPIDSCRRDERRQLRVAGLELLERGQGRTLNSHVADENWLSSRAQRGICFSLTLEADPVLFGVARAVRALPLLSPNKQDYSLAKRNRSTRETRATPDKLLRAPASRSLVAALLGMTII